MELRTKLFLFVLRYFFITETQSKENIDRRSSNEYMISHCFYIQNVNYVRTVLYESTEKLKDRFSDQDREELSQTIKANYEKLRLIMLGQELLQRRCR